AGCGSSKKSSSTSATPAAPATTSSTPTTSGGAAGGTVKLTADPGGALKFDKTSATAKAGTVTLDMTNPATIQHGIAIEGNGVDKDGKIVSQGQTSTLAVTLKPGKYTFYCPVPGHKQAGMKGK